MATTTNYGWVTPDDTDLVKDGAAAIRTLGSSVDTSFVDLLGGSTGQVLTKASATDLDFTFATPASGGMTLLSTTTLTGNSVTISGIPSGHDNLLLLINSTTSAVSRWQIRPNASTSISDGAATAGSATTYTGVSLNFPFDSASGVACSLNLQIFDYASTTIFKSFIGGGGLGDKGIILAGGIRTNSAITSLVIKLETLAHTMSGTARLFGVK